MNLAVQVLSLLVALTLVQALNGTYPYPTGNANFTCMTTWVHDAVIDCWNSTGGSIDSYCLQNYNAALKAGIFRIDFRIDLCPRCNTTYNNGSAVVSAIQSFMSQNNITGNTLYFTILNATRWSDSTFNRQYFHDAITQAQSSGIIWGVYSNAQDWQLILNYWEPAYMNGLVWYTGDNGLNLEDWSKYRFGNWNRPNLKTFFRTSSCGSFDILYHP